MSGSVFLLQPYAFMAWEETMLPLFSWDRSYWGYVTRNSQFMSAP